MRRCTAASRPLLVAVTVAGGTPAVVSGEPGAGRRTQVGELERSTAVFVGVVVLTVAPVIAAAVSLVGRHWHPASDLALQLLQIDDVGGRHTPLTGAHSRYGWDHPGPLLFWLLAPFDWLFGTTGVLVGTALLNTAAMVGALFVARRRGGVTLTALVAVMLLVLTLANDTDLFVNPWNPWVAVLPFFTYLLLAWSLADGDIVMLPWLIGVGSFIVQAHVGYAPLVLGAGVIGGVMAWRSRRVEDGGGRLRSIAVVSIATAAVLWLPPILQQLFSDEGNLAAIIEFFRDPPEAQAGWRLAWGIMGTELGPPGAWLAGGELGAFGVLPGSTVPAVILLAVTVAAGVVAVRHGAASAARLTVLVVASCARRSRRHVAHHRADRHVSRPLVVGAGRHGVAVDRLVGGLPPGAAGPARLPRGRARGHGDPVGGGHHPRRAGRPARRRPVGGGRRLGRRADGSAGPRRRLRRRLDRRRVLGRGGDRRLRRARAPRLRRLRRALEGAGVRSVADRPDRGRRRDRARHRQHRRRGWRRAASGGGAGGAVRGRRWRGLHRLPVLVAGAPLHRATDHAVFGVGWETRHDGEDRVPLRGGQPPALVSVLLGSDPLHAVVRADVLDGADDQLATIRSGTPTVEWFGVNGGRVDVTVSTVRDQWRIVYVTTDGTTIDSLSVFRRPPRFDGIAGGRVIVLNGASGSGKSSLLEAIAEVSDLPWVLFDEPVAGAVDQGYLIWRDRAPVLHRGFLDAIGALAGRGNLVALSAAGHPAALIEEVFGGLAVLRVGLDCDLPTLVARAAVMGAGAGSPPHRCPSTTDGRTTHASTRPSCRRQRSPGRSSSTCGRCDRSLGTARSSPRP